MKIKQASINDVELLFSTISELRPHLTLETFKEQLAIQFQEGYQLIFIGDKKEAFATLGFRTLNLLYSGKTLYIDDLVTNSLHQKKGYAKLLFDWVKNYAKENNYEHLSLDSGFSRKDAHRFYLNQGLEIESFHFGKKC